MNIINERVKHKVWGVGVIGEKDGNIISVDFNGTIKKLQFPDAFEKFLTFEETALQDEVVLLLDKKEIKAKEHLVKLEKKVKQISQRRNKTKKVIKGNIAIKCTLCDGGKTDQTIGFTGVCSPEMIKTNISSNKVWCKKAKCKNYYDEEITYDELLQVYEEEGKVCFESTMLKDLVVGAGVNQNPKKSGDPRKFREVRTNGLLVYTTRLPKEAERERIIVAISVIDEYFEGDKKIEGRITGSEKYTIKLSLEEAKQLKFWDFYYNVNNPKSIQFSTGLFRYLDNQQSMQIIQKIGEIKKDHYQGVTAKELLEYYGEVNGLDITKIEPAKGPLLTQDQ